jgi:hypothetical protein
MIKWFLAICICCGLLTGCSTPDYSPPPGTIRITTNPQYDKKMVDRILKNWFELSNNSDVNFNTGEVVVSFVLHSDGTVTGTDITANNIGYLPGMTCVEAVLKSSPYPKWSSAMVKKLGDHCDVEFTFNYHGR